MMRRQRRDQGRLSYAFRLGDRIPEKHLLRRMNVFVTAASPDAGRQRPDANVCYRFGAGQGESNP
jgi:hypothetical protein